MEAIEIEFKSLLTKQCFDELKSIFNGKKIIQTNYYFDSNDNILKQHDMALRIRVKESESKITVKNRQDKNEVAIEVSELIDSKNVDLILASKTFNVDVICDYLKSQGINQNYFPKVMCFKTNRVRIEFDDHTLFLDETIYASKIDYELEIEADSYDVAKEVFDQYAKRYNLVQSNLTKIARAYQD